ncbi:hypothetical protein C8R46DRAFT_266363 [Mycena filopes]|nr:hypothetical protein C8R46DRAFT_266363 [Mycena filopes]
MISAPTRVSTQWPTLAAQAQSPSFTHFVPLVDPPPPSPCHASIFCCPSCPSSARASLSLTLTRPAPPPRTTSRVHPLLLVPHPCTHPFPPSQRVRPRHARRRRLARERIRQHKISTSRNIDNSNSDGRRRRRVVGCGRNRNVDHMTSSLLMGLADVFSRNGTRTWRSTSASWLESAHIASLLLTGAWRDLGWNGWAGSGFGLWSSNVARLMAGEVLKSEDERRIALVDEEDSHFLVV